MCGFVGIASPRARRLVSPPELGRMLGMVAHRGPDDEATSLHPGLALGFRRLSIVDPEHGRQPMSTEDGSLVLVCNGEIYNHEALREVLMAKGHRFRTRSDSEALLCAYREWGEECPARLRGIFAFAIADRARRRVFFCRDRSGVKPLYLREDGDELLFGSEAKALLAHPSTPRRLDLLGCFAPAELDALFEASPFAGIRQLGAGCWATFDGEGLRAKRYWTYAPSAEVGSNYEGPPEAEELREALSEVVRMQLMADVPVGACLSGGLDSSVVTALARRHADGLATFTSVCAGSDDAWFAHLLAESSGVRARHYVRFEPAEMVDELARVAWAAEGTFDLGFVARYQLASVASRQGIKVLLSGQGADELLGGYNASYAVLAASAQRAENAARLLETGWSNIASALRASAKGEPAAVARHLRNDHAALSHYLLRFEDRMGMLAGVEVRVPFLDHGIVELCAGVGGERRRSLFGDKRLLREAAKGIVPDGIRLRPKYGFNGHFIPMSQLVTRLGRETPVSHLLADRAVSESPYFDPTQVRRLADAGNYRALDAVLSVHLLDELFVSRIEPPSGAPRAPLAPEIAVDVSFLPAERVLFLARAGPSPGDKPWLSPAVTHFGILRETGSTQPTFLASQLNDGRRGLVRLPAELREALVVAFLNAADGTKTYVELATALGTSVEAVLEVGRLAGEHGLLEHGPRALPPAG